jgi:hypothetical protein
MNLRRCYEFKGWSPVRKIDMDSRYQQYRAQFSEKEELEAEEQVMKSEQIKDERYSGQSLSISDGKSQKFGAKNENQ